MVYGKRRGVGREEGTDWHGRVPPRRMVGTARARDGDAGGVGGGTVWPASGRRRVMVGMASGATRGLLVSVSGDVLLGHLAVG